MAEPLLKMRGICKSFPGVRALDAVQLDARAGQIHALMGENGAGKSTLIKILTGFYRKDSGSSLLGGQQITPRSPKEAEALGISTVYQEINLLPALSVTENIVMGREPVRFGCIQWGRARGRAERALARIGLSIDVSAPLSAYSVAVQQMVALARALDIDAKLLVLDEPTSSLDEQETASLFQVMRQLRDSGLAILFVTHFLDQVYEIADAITVLRNGSFVGEFAVSELPRIELIAKMLGKELAGQQASADAQPQTGPRKILIEARRLAKKGRLNPIDLELREGEVVGLAGLLGSGRTEAARLLFGADAPDSGEIRVRDEPVRVRNPRDALRHGFAFCSEDRKSEGIIPNLSVQENLLLALQVKRGVARKLSSAEQSALAEHYIRALDIRTPSPHTPIKNLSGGNQQKVLLARWLALQPQLIILDEPTRGIDVGAKAEIEKLVRSLREEGMAVLFISSELDEIVRTCQRVAVLRDRNKVGELEGAALTEQQIMHLIARHET